MGAFQIDAAGSGTLKAGLGAATELKGFADGVESDLKKACSGLATDLGGTGTFETADAACKGALKSMADVKAKMGASFSIKLEIKPPECRASMEVMGDCAAHCDASIKPGEAKVECEPGKLSGTCSAQCTGSCDLNAAAKCDGSCSGTCDGAMKGSCGGKCDGKAASGAACAGTCEGKCDASIEGSCSGSCGGTCKLKASASCNGTCNGSCSATMQAPKCTGEVKPPQMSADCKAKCDAKVSAKAECSPAAVGVKIEGRRTCRQPSSTRPLWRRISRSS